MLYERKKVLTHRLIWLFILLLIIFIPIFSIKTVDNLEILDDNGSIVDYYSSLNETACEMNITFNMDVTSGYVRIKFYDSNGYLLDTVNEYFISYGNYIENDYIIVDGKVDSYEIVSYDVEPENNIFYIYMIIPFPLAFFICSLLVCYKKYDLDENEIIVYAGFYHHYIKINGEKYDEHNTLVSWTPIYLSCQFNENVIEATVSMTNRISTKLNGKLLKNN